MVWRAEQLQPASFRGVPFQVVSSELGAGRRTQVHEYPQRDKPWVEDLGRATREISFDAFVVGDDYVAQANKLIEALEAEGPGTLVHPWFGTLTVSIKDLGRVSFDGALGQARIALSFVESGELDFPAAASSTQAVSRLAASKLSAASQTSFAKKFSATGGGDLVEGLATGNVTNVFDYLKKNSGLDAALDYSDKAADALQEVLGAMSSPTSMANYMARYLGVTRLVGSVRRWSSLARAVRQLASGSSLAQPASSSINSAQRQQAIANETALNALVRQQLLVQAIGASSMVEATEYDDTVALRDELAQALDDEMLLADDDVYDALRDARASMWADLSDRSSGSARLRSYTPRDTVPALVIAFDLYEDLEREAEIITRNRIRHPGFVPPEPLRVLDR